MPDTVEIDVPKQIWTDVSGSNNNGLLTNSSQYSARIREAVSKPDDDNDIGHVLNPQENTYFYLAGSQKLWVKGLENAVKLAKTPGLGLSKNGYFTRDFLLEVNQGNIPGHELIHKFGSNSDVGTTKEDLWEVGGLIPWMLAAETMDVVSSDTTNDIITGSGARELKITGLDTNFDKVIETVPLGATPVTTLTAFRRIQTLEIAPLGVGTYTGANLGNITLIGSSSATTQGIILIGEGRSSQTQFTIEAGKTGYVVRISITMSTGKEVNVNLHNREGADIVAAPFNPNLHLHHWDGLATPIEERFLANHKLLEKTDVWLDGEVPVTAAGIDVDYDILVVDNIV